MADCSLTLGALDLMAAPYSARAGTTFGPFKAITTEVTSLFADGAVVAGETSGNRLINLEVKVTADTYDEMVEAIEALAFECDQLSNELILTHEGGVPNVYEVLRNESGLEMDASKSTSDLSRTYRVPLPAKPYPRADQRQQPSAEAPVTTVALLDGESSPAGVQMLARPAQPSWGVKGAANAPWWAWDAPVAVEGQAAIVETHAPVAGDVSVLSGTGLVAATVAAEVKPSWWRLHDGGNFHRRGPDRSRVVVTCGGTGGEARLEAAAASAIPSGAEYVTAGWPPYLQGNVKGSVNESAPGVRSTDFGLARGPHTLQTGIRFTNGAAGPTVDTVWGAPAAHSHIFWPPTSWATAPVPPGATHFRRVLRWLDAKAGQTLTLLGTAAWASMSTGVAPTAEQDDDPNLPTGPYRGTGSVAVGRGYVHARFTSPIDVSAYSYLRARGWQRGDWRTSGTPANGSYQSSVSVRLHSAGGRWTQYRIGPDIVAAGGNWVPLSVATGTVEATSTLGGVLLTAVTSVDVSYAAPSRSYQAFFTDPGSFITFPHAADLFVDELTIGIPPASTVSPRGSVATLPIHGSARSPARVRVVNNIQTMVDCVISIVPPGIDPILPISAARGPNPDGSGTYPTYGGVNVAYNANRAISAPTSRYKGTYSLIAAVVPAVAIPTPVDCVIRQYDAAGNIVEQEVKTALQQRVGNRYVDFGNVTLPLREVAEENTGAYYTFDFRPARTTSQERTWADLLLLDVTQGMAFIDGIPMPQKYVWVDEPAPNVDIGPIMAGSVADRSDASIVQFAYSHPRPLFVRGPSVQLLAYSTSGTPDIELSYYPRGLSEIQRIVTVVALAAA